jgi:hypothetical protein
MGLGLQEVIKTGSGKHFQERTADLSTSLPPDFLLRTVALMDVMQFPLLETAHVGLASAA